MLIVLQFLIYLLIAGAIEEYPMLPYHQSVFYALIILTKSF